MESIEMNEVVTQETVDAIKDVVPAWKPDGKSMLIGGAIAYAGVVIGEYVVRPLIRKMMNRAADRRAAKKTNIGEPAEPQIVDVDLEEDLKIDDEEEES